MKYPSWFVPLSGTAPAPLRLFAFPYSGGSAASFGSWKGWMPPDVELLGVQLPGRAMRMREPVISEMEKLVDEIVPHMLPLLHQPYQLFGHSNGALMAFAVANRLARLGVRMPEAVIMSAKRSPTVPYQAEILSTLPEDKFLDKLKDLNGTPRELLENIEFMRLFSPAIRADFSLGETFRLGTVDPKLAAVPALLLAGQDDGMPVEHVFAWRDIFKDSEQAVLKGGHFFLNSDPLFGKTIVDFCRAKSPGGNRAAA